MPSLFAFSLLLGAASSAQAGGGLNPTINFYTPDKNNVYLIVFDTVYFNGNLACSNIPHKLWAVDSDGFKSSCQDIMIPAEMVYKQYPVANASSTTRLQRGGRDVFEHEGLEVG